MEIYSYNIKQKKYIDIWQEHESKYINIIIHIQIDMIL